tara:strand:- start:629 stop:811 length:183 start_codon:yes stop_codon:yes gene_type:complete
MVEEITYVLENYPNANLSSTVTREIIAKAIQNYICETNLVMQAHLSECNDVYDEEQLELF